MFYNRGEELSLLNEKYAGLLTGELIVIYGRRRVGKTELVRKFISKIERSLYLYIDYASPVEVLDIISNDISRQTGDFVRFRDWDTFYSYLSSRGGVVVLDEFQRLFEIDKKAITRLQRIWDIELKDKHLMLVLVGSSIGMMRNAALSGTAPLYGRVTSTIKLQPLDYRSFRHFFTGMDEIKKVQLYAIFGGTPYYLKFVKDYETEYIQTIIQETVLKKGAPLQNEPINLLHMELTEIARYNSILSAISSGKHTFKEISDYSGIETNNISYYIDNLSKLLDLTVAADPVGGKKKSARYAIKDNFFRFWYRFIFKNHAALEVSTTDMVTDIIMEQLNNYLAFAFEDIVRELFVHYNGRTIKGHSIKFSTIGAWWNRIGDEIDICASGDGKMYLGEVKWTDSQVGCNVAVQLVKKSQMVRGSGEKIFMMVSKTGFTAKCIRYMDENDWIYLDMNDITMMFGQL